ncbi:MAG: hypothetical protein F6J93_09860 [Oscillatoria sp. SIO1A7]|nr:hypothetical protein [Oscillatoria sp. SIO1A7]
MGIGNWELGIGHWALLAVKGHWVLGRTIRRMMRSPFLQARKTNRAISIPNNLGV